VIKLPNPLKTKERLRIPRLLGHNSHAIIGRAMRKVREDKKDLATGLLSFIGDIEETVEVLTHGGGIYLGTGLNFLKDYELQNLLRELNKVYEDELKIEVEINIPFSTSRAILNTLLGNIIDNAINIQYNQRRKITKVRAEFLLGFPETAIYIPDGARDYQEFVRFSVQNPGEFPRDKPLMDRLTICPERGKRGFGLYFTGLAAKVLRAPVDIKSEKEIVDVSFYHPIYRDEERT